jgi:thimet oligopeptidase
VGFYADRVRRVRYAVDAERLRVYFPPEASLRFAFRLAEKLFGIAVEPVEQGLWHPEARAFAVRDAQGGGPLLGTLFVDLYPRADKYNHAAQWGVRSGSTASARLPVAGLVVNFNRRGLALEELHTLLHEFGHALHTLLSATRYASQGGANVQWDFVEAPSQMFEDWAYRPEALTLMREVCPACKPVPPGLIAQADRARRFGMGINVSRQHLLASYDLALHGRVPAEPMALWTAMEAETPLGHVSGSQLPAGFGHLAGGYAAGYYGYLWSEAMAEDLRTPFVGHWLDPSVGRRYRDAVLANGGQAAPAELMQQFLGRPTNRQAFFKALARE